MSKNKHIFWHVHKVSRKAREAIKKQRARVIWFTGLPSSGKSTLAGELEFTLNSSGLHTYILDGDNIRCGLNKDLGFNAVDRRKNIRRVSEVAKLFVDAGIIAITAFISPFTKDREWARGLFKKGEFIEVYVKCPLPECLKRDPKGLYKKAKKGKIKDFTGLNHPYQEPRNPEITVETDKLSVEESVKKILSYLRKRKIYKV